MADALLHLDPAFTIAPLNRRIFGTFVEHLGRCVYTGIYEPTHPTADEHGFRSDVAELVGELAPTIVRYPGGNFVSNYRWEDGVGPRDRRPTTFDFAWCVTETNQVGTDEFLAWCERLGVEAMLAVNLGTRGLEQAMEYVEYVNGRAGTRFADQRVANGRREPWDVRVWCLGNEMDGPWQIGHQPAEEYARIAEKVGNAYKRFDPGLELVACGSSNRQMPTFGEWERVVLERAFDHVDHISAHAYYELLDGDEASFLASADDMDRFIEQVVATADHVAALRRSDKRITISFDEWNVWFLSRALDLADGDDPSTEEIYSAMDAVVVGSLLITLMRHTDRVAMACMAQLVNVLAPIRTTPGGAAWRTAIFHPTALTTRYARGEVLRVGGASPRIETTAYGPVEQVWSTATWDAESGRLALFAVNRSPSEPVTLRVALGGFDELTLIGHDEIHEDDPYAANTEDAPDRVVPHPGTSSVADCVLAVTLPPVSWHCVRLSAAPQH